MVAKTIAKPQAKHLLAQMSQNGSDDFQTPSYAIKPLLPYISKDMTIWEMACGKGFLVDAFLKEGYKVIWSDIVHDPTEDFLTMPIRRKADVLITNPPDSLKNEFIAKCYDVGKPFALLMPLSALETPKRQKYYSQYGIQLIIPDCRVEFLTPSGQGSGSWFLTAWYTWGLNLPRDLNFVHMDLDGSSKNG